MNYSRIFLLILLCGLFSFAQKLEAQNLFDTLHTEKYANHLFATHDYQLASEEFDRLLFMTNSNNDSLRWMVVKSTRLAGNADKACQRMLTFYPDTQLRFSFLSKEYLQILFHKKEYPLIRKEVSRIAGLDTVDRLFYGASNEFLSNNYAAANTIIQSFPPNNPSLMPLANLQHSVEKMKHKNPAIAGTLSAIIPGLGQTYAGNWKDGIFAMILTGSSTFQAYRGFHKNGVESIYGWVFSAMATAFYTANVYGAVKASHKYNYLNHLKISIQVETLLDNYYN